MEPKTANLTPKQVQNDHGGAKMAQTGPETGFLRFWGSSGRKTRPKWSQNGPKIDQTFNQKTIVF
jgi:hypothetical protein